MKSKAQAIDRRMSDYEFSNRLIRRSFLLNIMQSAGLVVLGGVVWRQSTYQPQPKYFYTDGKNEPYPIRPLDAPVMDDAELLTWTARAILATYNIDFVKYREQLQEASKYFTYRGWNSFGQSFKDSGNFARILKSRLVASAVPKKAPTITNKAVIGGVLTYQIGFPIVVTYENENQSSNNSLLVRILVIRTVETEHPDGVAVDEVNASPA